MTQHVSCMLLSYLIKVEAFVFHTRKGQKSMQQALCVLWLKHVHRVNF